MFRWSRGLIFAVVAAAIVLFSNQPVRADLLPLPSLPAANAINRVVAAGRLAYFPLGVPSRINEKLHTTYQYPAFAQLVAHLDLQNAVSYFGLDGQLRESVIPVIGASTSNLAPDLLTPDGIAAKGLGALYDINKGATLAVITFNGSAPTGLRFYTSDKLFAQTSAYFTRHLSHSETPADVGVLIAAREVCWTVGVSQACYSTNSAVLDQSVPVVMQQAVSSLAATYSFHANFDFGASVPNVAGQVERSGCFNTRKGRCQPDVVYTNTDQTGVGKIIGAISVLAPNDLPAFNVNGDFVGSLPPGNYLVIQTSYRQLNAFGALFLVGAYNFLIPAQVSQGFGDGGSNFAGQASIKASNLMWWWF